MVASPLREGTAPPHNLTGATPINEGAAIDSPAWVYILRGPHGDFYVGKTVDLHRRLWRHRESLTRGYTEYQLLCFFPCESDAEAKIYEREAMRETRDAGHIVNTVYGYRLS